MLNFAWLNVPLAPAIFVSHVQNRTLRSSMSYSSCTNVRATRCWDKLCSHSPVCFKVFATFGSSQDQEEHKYWFQFDIFNIVRVTKQFVWCLRRWSSVLGGIVNALLLICQEDAFLTRCCWILPIRWSFTSLTSDLQGTWSDEGVVLFDVLFFYFLFLSLTRKIRIWHFPSDVLRYCHSTTLAVLPAWISKGCELDWYGVSSTEKRRAPRPADKEFSQRLPPSSCTHEVVKSNPPTFVSRQVEFQLDRGLVLHSLPRGLRR